MRIALVGLPGSGKTTLFGALGGRTDPAGAHGARGPAVATIPLLDPRLDLLAEHFEARKRTPAALTFEDHAGLTVAEESEGKAQLVAALRLADGLCKVLRGFVCSTVAYSEPTPDPIRDHRRLTDELAVADLTMLERRVEKLTEEIRRPTPAREEQQRELTAAQHILPALYDGQALGDLELSPQDRQLFRGFQFLSEKPSLVVVNQPESDAPRPEPETLEPVVSLVATYEREIAQVGSPEEREELMGLMGIQEPARVRVEQAACQALGLISFFTVKGHEVRATLIHQGTPAVEAAGKIHSDMQRGFIRAEVVSWDDYASAGGMREVKARKRERLEGKEYVVADGDIVTFRFSV